jgi:hypothetical protein
MTTAEITANWDGRLMLSFPHTTGVIFFPDIDYAGKWIRSHGGELGRRLIDPANGENIGRQAMFQATAKLPVWAKP